MAAIILSTLAWNSVNLILYRVRKSFRFQNETENKCGVYLTSHPHQSIENLSKLMMIVVARLKQMALVLKMATPQQKSWCVL
jgi:hypothetical protein